MRASPQNPQIEVAWADLFLEKYDAGERQKRGVYCTPGNLVLYIVRAVQALLRTDFGPEDGLADPVLGVAHERPSDAPMRRDDPIALNIVLSFAHALATADARSHSSPTRSEPSSSKTSLTSAEVSK